MKVLDSKLRTQVIKTKNLDFGSLHFFENVIISEINNGVHVDANNYLDIIIPCAEFYGTKRSLGYISNRINNYSISPIEISKIDILKNINISTSITYCDKDTKIAKFEERFCKTEMKNNFSDLYSGFNWVNQLILNKIQLN